MRARIAPAGSRRCFLVALALCAAFALRPAFAAHGASPLKVVESATVDAPPEKLWAVISDFARADWLPGVARVEAEGGNTPDRARRRLFLTDGAVIEETLTKWDAARMIVGVHRDRDDVKRLPAVNLTTIVTVAPLAEGGSSLEWKARFYRGYPNNNPPPELNDDVALAAVTALVRADLAALKAKAEQR